MVQEFGIQQGYLIVPFGFGFAAIPLWLVVATLLFVAMRIASAGFAVSVGSAQRAKSGARNP